MEQKSNLNALSPSPKGRAIYVTFCIFLLSGCAVTYESEDGSLNRIGFVWDSYKKPLDQRFSTLSTRTVGLGIDVSNFCGGVVLGYRKVDTVFLEGDAALYVELDDGMQVVKYCTYQNALLD